MSRRRPPASRRRPGVSRCPSCDELIVWCQYESGEKTPVDLHPVETGNLQLTPRGTRLPLVVVVSKGGRPPGTQLYVSHFKSCRAAEQHRRPKQPQRQAAPPEQGALFDPTPPQGGRR